MNLVKGTYSLLPQLWYYNHIWVSSTLGLSCHVREDWWCSYWAITFIYLSPCTFLSWVTFFSLSPFIPCFSLLFFLPLFGFVPFLKIFFSTSCQICPTDVSTGWTPSCTFCQVWILTETTAKCCYPPITTLDTRSPLPFLRYKNCTIVQLFKPHISAFSCCEYFLLNLFFVCFFKYKSFHIYWLTFGKLVFYWRSKISHNKFLHK